VAVNDLIQGQPSPHALAAVQPAACALEPSGFGLDDTPHTRRHPFGLARPDPGHTMPRRAIRCYRLDWMRPPTPDLIQLDQPTMTAWFKSRWRGFDCGGLHGRSSSGKRCRRRNCCWSSSIARGVGTHPSQRKRLSCRIVRRCSEFVCHAFTQRRPLAHRPAIPLPRRLQSASWPGRISANIRASSLIVPSG
jgi:hypothetical protein